LLGILTAHEGDAALADGEARLRDVVRNFGGRVGDEPGAA
jgi:hypothetical protein